MLVRAETTGFCWSVSGATASKCSAKRVQFLLPFHKQERVSVCQRVSLETGSERKKQEVNSATGGPSPRLRFGMSAVGTWRRCYFVDKIHLLPRWFGSVVSREQALSHRRLVGISSLPYPSRSKILRGCCYIYLPFFYCYTENTRWSHQETFLFRIHLHPVQRHFKGFLYHQHLSIHIYTLHTYILHFSSISSAAILSFWVVDMF